MNGKHMLYIHLDIICEYDVIHLYPAVCARDRLSLNVLMQALYDEFSMKISEEPKFIGYAISQQYRTVIGNNIGMLSSPINSVDYVCL